MVPWPVSTRVNKPENHDPTILDRLAFEYNVITDWTETLAAWGFLAAKSQGASGAARNAWAVNELRGLAEVVGAATPWRWGLQSTFRPQLPSQSPESAQFDPLSIPKPRATCFPPSLVGASAWSWGFCPSRPIPSCIAVRPTSPTEYFPRHPQACRAGRRVFRDALRRRNPFACLDLCLELGQQHCPN